jgi:hypothetical protein
VHSGKLGPGGARLDVDFEANGWHGDATRAPRNRCGGLLRAETASG